VEEPGTVHADQYRPARLNQRLSRAPIDERRVQRFLEEEGLWYVPRVAEMLLDERARLLQRLAGMSRMHREATDEWINAAHRLTAIDGHLGRAFDRSSERCYEARIDSAEGLRQIARRPICGERLWAVTGVETVYGPKLRPARQMCRAADDSERSCPNLATLVQFKIVVGEGGARCEVYPVLCDRHFTKRRVDAEVARLTAPTSVKDRCQLCGTVFSRAADDVPSLCPFCAREAIFRDHPDLDPFQPH
jgi:predicted Zn-ribbon and HTH transcriptional regulator